MIRTLTWIGIFAFALSGAVRIWDGSWELGLCLILLSVVNAILLT